MLIRPNEPLPVEMRIEREKRRALLRKNRPKNSDYPVLEVTDWFNGPFSDLSIVNLYTHGGKNGLNSSYSLVSSGILGGIDTEFSLNRSSNDNDTIIRLKGAKFFLNNGFSWRPKKIAVGDITLQSDPLLANSASGRGFIFSNYDSGSYHDGNSIEIRGELPVGWEVEIFQNGNLLDFKIEGEDGLYIFEDLPVIPGLNIFDLFFYGSQGQRREEKKSIFVYGNTVKKRQFFYEFAALEDDKNLIEPDKTIKVPENRRFYGNFNYGLTSLVSLNLNYYLLQKERTSQNAIENNFFKLGILFPLPWTSWRYSIATDIKEKTFAHNASLRTKLLNWSVYLSQTQYRDFVSERTGSSIGRIKTANELRTAGSFNLYSLGRVSASLQLKRSKNTLGKISTDVSNQLSYSFLKGYYLNLNTGYVHDYSKKETLNTTLRLNKRYGNNGLKGSVTYRIKPEGGLANTEIGFERNFGLSKRFFVGWQKNYTARDSRDSYSSGVSYVSKFGAFGLDTKWTSLDTYSVSINYTIGLGVHKHSKSLKIAPKKLSSYGTIICRVFVDRNADGKFNHDDTPVENVGFNIQRQEKTDKNGYAYLAGIAPYQEIEIKIRKETLEDSIFLIPRNESNHVMLRPGSSLFLDFPIIETGDIEGNVFINRKKFNDFIPAKGMAVNLLDQDRKIISKYIISFDGYFLFQQLPLGEYILQIDKEQLIKLGFKDFKEMKVKITAENQIVILDDLYIEKM